MGTDLEEAEPEQETDLEEAEPEQETDLEEAEPEAESETDVEESAERRHGKETDGIRRLLNAIKAKLARELSSARRSVSKVIRRNNAAVARAQRAFNANQMAMQHSINVRNRAAGALAAAKRSRTRAIKSAKRSQSWRVQRKERELMMIHNIECKLYQLNGSKKVHRRCMQSYRRRVDRYQDKYLVGSSVKTYSGYCSRHSRGNGWGRYCLNGKEYNQLSRFISVSSNGYVRIKKTGYYRLHFRAIQYCNNWCQQDLRTLVDGRQINYSHKNHQHSWTENENDMTIRLREGQRVQFQAYVRGGNPYRYHSGNARGAHSRVQISFFGSRKPVHSSYCSKSKGSGWHRYCNNRVEYTNSRYFRRSGSQVYVKKAGMYRINARSIIYTRGWGSHHSRVHINGKQRSYTHDYNVYWAPVKGDFLWPLRAGDRVSADFYSNRGHSYHSGSSNGAHSRFQMSYEGPKSMPVFSGYCNRHDRHRRHWRTYCINRREFNTAKRHLRVSSGGVFEVLKSGSYRIDSWALQHTSNYCNRNTRVHIHGDGSYRSYGYTHGRSWNRLGHNFIWRLRKGQKFQIQYYVGGCGNPYTFHSGSTHSRTQVSYVGKY